MKINKNIFALAICFSVFTMQADNSNDSTAQTVKTIKISIQKDDVTETIIAVVVTPEQAFDIFSKSINADELSSVEIVDGLVFKLHETVYIVQSEKSVDDTTNSQE